MLSEAAIIARLKTAFPTHIGDDAAVILPSPLATLITKDLLVEHKHFNTNYVDAASLAHKALHVNLSDLAAMGANPRYILLGIAIPPRLSAYAETFLASFASACKAVNVVLIGGDTTASANDLFISVTAIGDAEPAHIKHRDTAKPDHLICVAGALGKAHLGLIAFENNAAGFEDEKQAFLKPNAKIQEGLWLGKQACVRSMMDISDGLYIDLKRLCEASHVGAAINLETLPCSREFSDACTALKLDATQVRLTGGEDYGLLFTVNADDYENLAATFMHEFHYSLLTIGKITQDHDVKLLEKDKPVPLTLTPFNHFGESL